MEPSQASNRRAALPVPNPIRFRVAKMPRRRNGRDVDRKTLDHAGLTGFVLRSGTIILLPYG